MKTNCQKICLKEITHLQSSFDGAHFWYVINFYSCTESKTTAKYIWKCMSAFNFALKRQTLAFSGRHTKRTACFTFETKSIRVLENAGLLSIILLTQKLKV